jgi:hypothetical protein
MRQQHQQVRESSMRKAPQCPQETLQLDLDAATFKELLRDLLFREAGKPYFKRFAIPRRRRFFGAWQVLSTYQAERQLLPVGKQGIDHLIRQFFTTHGRLRAEFQEGGMPVTAIHVLRQRCLSRNAALEQIQVLECALNGGEHYSVHLLGGPAPPPESETEMP